MGRPGRSGKRRRIGDDSALDWGDRLLSRSQLEHKGAALGHQRKAQQRRGPLSTKSIDLGAGDGGPEWGNSGRTSLLALPAVRRRKRPSRPSPQKYPLMTPRDYRPTGSGMAEQKTLPGS